MLGLRWHRLARDAGVREGFDKLFKALVDRGRAGGFELTNEAVRAAGRAALGAWFEQEFDRHVTQAERIELPEDALAPALSGKVRPVFEFELGFERTGSLKEKRVHGLIAGSEAERAGLRDGDELTGWRIPGDADTKVELQVRRGEKLKTIAYYPRGAKQEIMQFSPNRTRKAAP
jgi:predicted metalloprotease with PDZ domain